MFNHSIFVLIYHLHKPLHKMILLYASFLSFRVVTGRQHIVTGLLRATIAESQQPSVAK
jgi:hypothetical protein